MDNEWLKAMGVPMKDKSRSGNYWYNHIEEPIRPLVQLLRNNGVNTRCSCGHEMYVECEYYGGQLDEVYELLFNNGFCKFKVDACVGFGWNGLSGRSTGMVIWLPKADGEFSKHATAGIA
jgi:hypothetical protein